VKYSLLGFGVSNKAVLDYLLNKGESVFVSEKRTLDDRTKEYLRSAGVEYEEGENSERIFKSDVIVVSPGVKPSHTLLLKARERGISITTELDLAYSELTRGENVIVAITGTNGKTTTTKLVAHLLSKRYRVFEGGNIGTPLISAVKDAENYEFFVCEVSSFQLHWSSSFKPKVGVLLNVALDHLDWHADFEDYLNSKLSMFKRQDANDIAFISKSIEEFVSDFESRIFLFDKNMGYHFKLNEGLLCFEDEHLEYMLENIPKHMRENLTAAVSVGLYLGLQPSEIVEGLNTFQSLPHRFEFVLERDGIVFVNDSKATNAHAVVAALNNFDKKNVILLLSGLGKNEDYKELSRAISQKCRAVIVFGEMKKLAERFVKNVPLVFAEDMKDAVKLAVEMATPKSVVLLSPAGASFDLYADYAERGEDFKRCVKEIMSETVYLKNS